MPSIDAYRAVRAQTIFLARPLSAEDHMVQSMPDASPTKWHLAHTSWFFETFVLAPHLPGYRVFDERFRFLFNSYYEAVGPRWDRSHRGLLSRPSLDTVHAYRRQVDQAMHHLLESEQSGSVADLIVLGLHHEQQHQELILTDIKHALAINPLSTAYRAISEPPAAEPPEPEPVFHRFDEGVITIGHRGDGFAFDNEGPSHRTFVRAFALAERPVTCGDYLHFMRDGGYTRPELWLSDGWQQRQADDWQAPMYWERVDGTWMMYTLSGVRPVDMNEPVCHVSYFEADAFARWAGARLPTEQEWECAAAGQPVRGHFASSDRFHPGPVASELFGDVWQWTQSPYVAYPGYQAAPGAIGEYNGKFMCNQMVLRGGSCLTPAGHMRASYRNFFPPAARWQMAGLRLARDA
jgi:ergothioneine biosynthesis protein EgtB